MTCFAMRTNFRIKCLQHAWLLFLHNRLRRLCAYHWQCCLLAGAAEYSIMPDSYKFRYFRNFASRNQKTVMLQCKKLVGYVFTKSKFAGLSWKEALLMACNIDLSTCPVCKTGKMELLTMFKSYRAPPIWYFWIVLWNINFSPCRKSAVLCFVFF